MSKIKKIEGYNPGLDETNPIIWFDEHGADYIIKHFVNKPLGKMTSVNSFSYSKDKKAKNQPNVVYENGYFKCILPCDLEIEVGDLYTPFGMLSKFIYKGNWQQAAWHVYYDLMGKDSPYIRVGTKYFKETSKRDHNGVLRTNLKVWEKATIVDDYGRKMLDEIPSYDDFTIEPDNKSHNRIVGGNYNLYAPFEHVPAKSFKDSDIKWTMKLMDHIFGEQIEIGIQYMKILYDKPKQKLPILVLTSEDRSTGKTTFLDYLELLFGANAVVVNPQDISGSFNAGYAASNIVMIEESKFESVQATEKLKNLATQKKILVNTKFVTQYSIPFYGKLVITSNDEQKFSRVDDKEIRYWVRKIPEISGKANHNILQDLRSEIPHFLAYLNSLPEVDTSKSRMVFDAAQLVTEALTTVKKESRSWLYKEIEILLDAHCQDNPQYASFKFISKDIKTVFFQSNPRVEVHYIDSVLKNEYKLPREKMQRYNPLESSQKKRSGTPFVFENPYYDPDSTERKRF